MRTLKTYMNLDGRIFKTITKVVVGYKACVRCEGLGRWKVVEPCPYCDGSGLNPIWKDQRDVS